MTLITEPNPINAVPYYQNENVPFVNENSNTVDLYATILNANHDASPHTQIPADTVDSSYLLNLSPDTFDTLAAANNTNFATASPDAQFELSLLEDLDQSGVNAGSTLSTFAAQGAASHYEQTILNAELYDTNTTALPASLLNNQLPITELQLNDTLDALPPVEVLQNIAATISQPATVSVTDQTNASLTAAENTAITAQNEEQTLTVLAEGSLIDLVS